MDGGTRAHGKLRVQSLDGLKRPVPAGFTSEACWKTSQEWGCVVMQLTHGARM
jgi:hypothetical protein